MFNTATGRDINVLDFKHKDFNRFECASFPCIHFKKLLYSIRYTISSISLSRLPFLWSVIP